MDDDGVLTIAGRVWSNGLAGLAPWQITDAIEKCSGRADPWPPSIPEFKAMALGIPSFLSVRMELNDSRMERSPFSRLVWAKLDTSRWRQASADKADKLLREAYDVAFDHVVSGGSMPDTAGNLPAPELNPWVEGDKAWRQMLEYGESMGLDIASLMPESRR